MKLCNRCKQQKNFDQFSKDKYNNDGLMSRCKFCIKQINTINSDKIKEHRKMTASRMKEYQKEYRKKNAHINKEYQKEYRKLNKDKHNQWKRKYTSVRRKTDSLYKFKYNIRALVRNSFTRKSRNFHKQSRTETILGCTITELRDYLASKFQPGMSFENHGEWHIDHIIPLASAKTQEDVEKLCHYTNLQPLWAVDNIKKGGRY